MSFFEELKRRNVVRVGIAYAVASWIILQATDVIGEILELPEWGGKLILLMIAVGFVLALILAWAFELTPEGIKRESEVDREASITPQTGRTLDRVIIGLLVLALGYFIWESRFKTPGKRAAPADEAPQISSATPAGEPEIGATADRQEQSIVVLPFVNMSADPNQEYFSDGLSEEILNALAQIDDLRVISRTSAFAFKDKDVSIPDIAAQLQVSHVLEGSVRTAGEQVRITAQLIEVDTDSHLWSEAYNRSLENVFEVQEEISRAIAGQLQLRLSDTRASDKPTQNVEAYRLYLRGRHHYQIRGWEDLQQALPLLEEAVTLDPGFADAWANLAAARMVTSFLSETGHQELYALAREAADRAVTTDPGNGLGQAVLGLLAFSRFDFEEAIGKLDRAIELNPNESNSFLWKGIVLSTLGYMDEAIAVMKEAETFDPAFTNLHNWLAGAYLATGDYEAAALHRDIALAVDPDFELNASADLAEIGGDMEAMERAIRSLTAANPDASVMVDAYLAALDDPSRTPAAVAAIRAYEPRDWQDPRPAWLFRLGAVEDSLEVWQSIVDEGRGLRASNGLGYIWTASDRASLADEAMPPFFEEFGLADYWRAKGNPDFCRPAGDRFACGDS